MPKVIGVTGPWLKLTVQRYRQDLLKVNYLDMRKALEDAIWKIEGRNGAAIRLGMAPSTLRERIKKHGINRSASTEGTSFNSS